MLVVERAQIWNPKHSQNQAADFDNPMFLLELSGSVALAFKNLAQNLCHARGQFSGPNLGSLSSFSLYKSLRGGPKLGPFFRPEFRPANGAKNQILV